MTKDSIIKSLEKSVAKHKQEFHNNPEKYLTIDEIGDLHLQWFYNRYAALRMIKNLPIFEKAYEVLTERKNFSRRNAFGEMHGDGYLWIEQHPTVKVIVEERQSYRFIFIKDTGHFHIRELAYQHNFPEHRRHELRNIAIQKFRKQGFAPYCPSDYKEERFDAFTYGDHRDSGYILSMDYYFPGIEKAEYANSSTISAIDSLKFWEPYLNDPSELE